MPKVSVIIPVYNVEKYLKQCIDSVINQTLKDIEIICVDDGSTDNCPQILDEYAKQDKRIKVIHKSNSGYGHSMNIGINNATGEYIGIVESDDWILPDMYQILYNKAKEHDLDFIKSDYYLYWGNYNCQIQIHANILNDYYNKILNKEYIDLLWKFSIANWTGIYKREFLNLNNIRHHESAGASYQDTGFMAQILSLAKNGMIIDKAFYMYRQDNPLSSVKSKQKMMCLLREYEFISNILTEKGLYSSLKICNAHRMSGHMWNFYRIDDLLKKEYASIIIDDYNKLKNDISWDKIANKELVLEFLNALEQNSEAFCDNIIKINENTKLNLKNSKHIIIYGTGNIGKNLYFKLSSLKYDDKVLFFAETNSENNKKCFGFDIKNAEEIYKYKNTALVIVAVSKKYDAYNQIIKNLNNLGITNYYDIDDFKYL